MTTWIVADCDFESVRVSEPLIFEWHFPPFIYFAVKYLVDHGCRRWLWICSGLCTPTISSRPCSTFSSAVTLCIQLRCPTSTFTFCDFNFVVFLPLSLSNSTVLSYFHFHFQQIQLYCLSSTFTFNLLIFLKWVVAPQPTKHLQCRLHFAMQGMNCDIFAFLYILRHHFQVPLMVSSSQVSNMFATVICKLVCICVKVTLIDQFTSSTLYMVRLLPLPKGLILTLR